MKVLVSLGARTTFTDHPMNHFTLVHILISLAGILSGFGMLSGMLAGIHFARWNAVFLVMTFMTSFTGFFFPFNGFSPALGFAVVSILVLFLAGYALLCKKLRGRWGKIYAVAAVFALYLNVFVLVVQTFQKNPTLMAIAPTQSEPAFAVTQIALLFLFLVIGITAVRRAAGA